MNTLEMWSEKIEMAGRLYRESDYFLVTKEGFWRL
jgi:hypothetical protein